MKVKGLFDNHDIVFLPIKEESIVKMTNSVLMFAYHNNAKVKTKTGIFIDPKTAETERVMRIEIIGYDRDKKKKEKKISDKTKKIKEDIINGEKISDICKKYEVSRQYVHALKKG